MNESTIAHSKPSSKILHDWRHSLNAIFSPQNVVVIGATEKAGSVGRTIVWNLIRNTFGGTVFPVNPKRANILGIKAYPSIFAVPAEVDLAVIVTPAQSVPQVLDDCATAGVKGAIIISAGFKEIGAEGATLERGIQEIVRTKKIRVIGPNCLGVMMPNTGLNATFASAMARPGNVGFVSQSGALCTAILDWSLRENIGFSAFISIGSMLDVGWGDLIDYLGDDPRTKSIVIYMESIGDARSFLSAAREVALRKPIIVIKTGRTEEAAKAAASHTGALTGSDEVLDAAFRRIGVLRVESIAELFYMADVLAKQPRPRGPRLTIVTNAGGPGVLATDALMKNGGKLATLAPETVEELNQFLPAHWSHNNPVDILGDANPERYAQALDIAAKDPNSDGLMVILTPQAMTDPTQTAEILTAYSKIEGKPLLASWMGGAEVSAGAAVLSQANIPVFPYPDTTARIFNYMWRYSYNLRGLYETPALQQDEDFNTLHREKAHTLIEKVRESRRTILTEYESKQILAAYGIPVTEIHIATTEEEAVKIAEHMGYPVVLKLHSETITHKTDVGGVYLNLIGADAVRRAFRHIRDSICEKAGERHFAGVSVQSMIEQDGYELIIGSSTDAQFGPVVLFGSGGQLVEVYKDRAIGLPLLNSTLARRIMEQTKIYQALQGVRGRKPINLAALENLFVKFSQLVVEQRWIKEMEINPLVARPENTTSPNAPAFVALDARVILHQPDYTLEELPKPAIRPYPVQYISRSTLSDGTPVTIRPIRPEDEPFMVSFHTTLSEQSVYFRYFHHFQLDQRTAHERLARMCFIDYDREIALVVVQQNNSADENEILAVGRLIKQRGTNEAELAVVVSDRYHKRGIGTLLVQHLVQMSRQEGIRRIFAHILSDNYGMQKVCKKIGFNLRIDKEEQDVKATLDL